MGKISSDVGVVQGAVAGFQGIQVQASNLSIGESNLAGMRAGVTTGNQLTQVASEFVQGVQQVANQFTNLATKKEADDANDAGGFKS